MLEFTPDLEINVPNIDGQHRELFKRINDVLAMGEKSAGKEETDKTLRLLEDYVVKHFGDEEALQKKSGYPKYEWHCEQHKLFLEDFKKLKSEYEKTGPSMEFTLRINKSVIDWLLKHIKFVDTELGKFLNSKT
ncbi:MAG: hemerythrin family protein [Treponema sp.]|nr:hemerythrin family protein [Treponema sp.]